MSGVQVTAESLDRIERTAEQATQGAWTACVGSARSGHWKPLAIGDAYPVPEGGGSCICRMVYAGDCGPVIYALDESDESFNCGEGVSATAARANARYVAVMSPEVTLALVRRIRELERLSGHVERRAEHRRQTTGREL